MDTQNKLDLPEDQFEIAVLGQRVNVKTNIGPLELRDLVVFIEDHVKQVKKQIPNAPTEKAYILTMLSLAEKYLGLCSVLREFKQDLTGELFNFKNYLERIIEESQPLPENSDNPAFNLKRHRRETTDPKSENKN